MKALYFVLGATLLLCNTANAVTDTAEDLDQIIVTAARTPLTVRQVGSAVTVITRAQIEQREVRLVSELLRSVPGFSVSRTGVTGSQTQVRVRGAEANHILVLIDGIRVNNPATGDEFRWEYLNTHNIERIEIVRGPQSSLWGSDAVSAVVHIITRSGVSDSGIDGYLEGGSFGTSNGGFNAAIGDDGWSLDASIEHLSTDGSNISRSGNEDDDSDLTTASLAGELAASDALSFNFGLRSVDAHSQFDPVDFFVTGLPVDGNRVTEVQNLYAHAGIAVQTSGGRISHRFDARYFDSDNDNFSDGSKGISSASDRLTLVYQGDIRLEKNNLSLAFEHEQTDFQQTGEIGFSDPNQTQSMHSTSAVAEFQNQSRDRLSWIVSARFDDNSDFDNALNGRLSLAYRLSDRTTLRGGVGTGQKNPTFTERFGFFPGLFIGNPNLKPERSTSYDFGVDQSILDDSLLLQISLFRQDLTDEINGFVFDPVTFLSTAANNVGDSERSGAEVALHWTVSDALDLGTHYTYTDSSEENGIREVRRPPHSGGVSARFQAARDRFGATFNADYGGTRTDFFFSPSSGPEIVTLSNYWLINLTLRYQATESVTLFARGLNLLDEDYEEVFGYRALGRTGYAGIRINFGR